MDAPDLPSFPTSLQRLLAEYPQRASSLVVTVFGDAVAPRGGELALASLLAITAAFGIQDGAVRTALSRLAGDGWIESRRRGRHSHYRLTPAGEAEFEAATRRIYQAAQVLWQGDWHVVVPGPDGNGFADLPRQGYAALTPTTWVRPIAPGEVPAAPTCALLAFTGPVEGAVATREQAARLWPLVELAEAYRAFLARFGPLAEAAALAPPADRLTALVARILLIHAFRRIALRDPQLPPALLPEDWPGPAARALCARLYRVLVDPSERWLDEHGRNGAGPLPPPGPAFFERFRGLD
jgi:phenylacetic acid degradation operon negative regulatory protein